MKLKRGEYDIWVCDCDSKNRSRRQFCDHLRLSHKIRMSRLGATVRMVMHMNCGEWHESTYEGECGTVEFMHYVRVKEGGR